MSLPNWSIVITTRNRAAMLRRAIESSVRQTVPCDVVVVDEASTDNTSEVVQQYPRVAYIRNPEPLGHSASANKGIRACRTEWIKPLDDDDWLTPDCVERMATGVEKARSAGLHPTLVSGNAISVDVEERELRRTQPLQERDVALRSRDLLKLMMLDQAPIGTPVQVGHRRDTALQVGGWNEHRAFTHQHGDEVELWIKLSAEGDAVFLPDFIGYRTEWAGGSQKIIPHEERVRSNMFLKREIAAKLGTKIPRGIEEYVALHWAIVALKEKNYQDAVKLGFQWLHFPMAAKTLLNRRQYKDAQALLIAI